MLAIIDTVDLFIAVLEEFEKLDIAVAYAFS